MEGLGHAIFGVWKADAVFYQRALVVEAQFSEVVAQIFKLFHCLDMIACCKRFKCDTGTHMHRAKRVPLDQDPRERPIWMPNDCRVRCI